MAEASCARMTLSLGRSTVGLLPGRGPRRPPSLLLESASERRVCQRNYLVLFFVLVVAAADAEVFSRDDLSWGPNPHTYRSLCKFRRLVYPLSISPKSLFELY